MTPRRLFAAALSAAPLAFALTSWPVNAAWGQEEASSTVAATLSMSDRWTELAIMAGLVAVILLLRWMDRPVRSETGSWSRLPFGRDSDEEPPQR